MANGGWNDSAYRESCEYSTATSASGSSSSSMPPWAASSAPMRLISR